ncbi:MAG TPA: bacteriocin fulvocin C-related protein [Pyrinomonadaceae bacterium]|jgi:hypothetical protein
MKKHTPMFFAFLLIGILGSFVPADINAQKAVSSDSKTARINIEEDDALQTYVKISSLPPAQQKKSFSEASAAEKSRFWKIHFALFLLKHPDLNERQREVFLETASSAKPETYRTPAADASGNPKPEKIQTMQMLLVNATSVFSKQEVGELLFNPGAGTGEIEILQKYQKISELSLSRRKQMFANFSAKEKSELWKLHIALNLVERDELTKDQKFFLISAASSINPEIFQISPKDSLWKAKVAEPLRQMTASVFEVFSKETGKEIFFELGGKSKESAAAEEDNLAPRCKCYIGYADACPYTDGGTCLPVSACEKSTSGCGILWDFPCNGSGCYR